MIAVLKAALCRLYNVLDRLWSPLLARADQPLVVFVDLLWSECRYCLAYRMLVLGVGLGLLFAGVWMVGLWLIGLVVLLVLIERAACGIDGGR